MRLHFTGGLYYVLLTAVVKPLEYYGLTTRKQWILLKYRNSMLYTCVIITYCPCSARALTTAIRGRPPLTRGGQWSRDTKIAFAPVADILFSYTRRK